MRLFENISQGADPQRPAWIPFLDSLAAGMEGGSPEEMLHDPTLWANAVPRAARLVSADAVAIGFMPGLCATAFDTDRLEPWNDTLLESLIETVHRLVETEHPVRDVIVAICGPATLARRVLGSAPDRIALDELKPGLVKTLEKLCACRPDMVVLDEYLEQETLVATPDFRRFCNTLKNVTGYFNVALGLRVSGYERAEEIVRELGILKIDHLLLGASADGNAPCLTREFLSMTRDSGWKSLGLPMGDGPLPEGVESPGLHCYYTSTGQDTDAERLRLIGAALTSRM